MGARKMTERRAVLVRLPAELFERARALKEPSFNELVAQALEREVTRRNALATIARIETNASRMRKQADSVPAIRAFRDGRAGRRD